VTALLASSGLACIIYYLPNGPRTSFFPAATPLKKLPWVITISHSLAPPPLAPPPLVRPRLVLLLVPLPLPLVMPP
jgi:hypothetical protein